MANSVVAYDRELPEIPDRRPWVPPDSHLVRDVNAPGGWRVAEGRRPSDLLLIAGMRERVDRWRDQGYPGASEVTRRLFAYWFEEDHVVAGYGSVFRYYFCQREAIEAVAYLVDVVGVRDTVELLQLCAQVNPHGLLRRPDDVVLETLVDGQRRVRRFHPEQRAERVQDLPPQGLPRYAFKMATGSGKTWVMAMFIVWSYFHKRRVPGSALSDNFAVIAPNVIVYQRLERDFASARVFHEIPLIPPEWRQTFDLKVILRGEGTEPARSGNLFVANIQHLYERSGTDEWTPANAVEALLGRRPSKDIATNRRPMLDRLKGLSDLAVLNDEAHHVHDEELAWHKALIGVHQALPKGLSMWLDFSATPKDQAGMYFPWTIVDYPLAQAVEDRIVKAPLIVSRQSDPQLPRKDPDKVTKANAPEKYAFWIHAAVKRWREHTEVYGSLGIRPILFVTTESSAVADAIGEYLRRPEFGFIQDEVLVIHTDAKGEVLKGDLDKARIAAREVDKPDSPVKVIVSVLMLKEGWDVRNVTVVLGLRPFTAKAEILPEQIIGRGLRIMPGVGPDRTQTLEVLGTSNLLDFLRDRLESEGVGFGEADREPPPLPVKIYPVTTKLAHDIAIPRTNASLTRNYRRLEEIRGAYIEPLLGQTDLDRKAVDHLRAVFVTTDSQIAEWSADYDPFRMAQDILSAITDKTMQRANLTGSFPRTYAIVRDYIRDRCFGSTVDLETKRVRGYLSQHEVQEAIAGHLATHIGKATVDALPIVVEALPLRLSEVAEFTWRRDLPPMVASRTIFNYVATYNGFERAFASLLETAPDVRSFASLSTTEQGESGVKFSVDYLKQSGAMGRYFPDFVAVQETEQGLVYWVIETKGRVYPGTEDKDRALVDWCHRVSAQTGDSWRFARINQLEFQRMKPKSLKEAVAPPTDLQPGLALPAQEVQSPPHPVASAVLPEPDPSRAASPSPSAELMAAIRKVFTLYPSLPLDQAVLELARETGQYSGTPEVLEELRAALRTAQDRDVLKEQAGEVSLVGKTIEQLGRELLKEQFLASLPLDEWIDRDDAAKNFARWLGFLRTGSSIRKTTVSLINGLLRQKKLERDGSLIKHIG